jgi:hypothetical protein
LYSLSLFVQTEKLWYYTFGSEKFNLHNSHFFELLIGFRCGLFLYTPAALFFIWLLRLCNFTVFQKLLYIFFLGCIIFLFSTWIDHCFGCRVGNRPMVDYYAAMLTPLLFTEPRRLSFSHPVIWIFPLFCTFYNQVLHYQYRHYLIDWCYMDAAKFKKSFLRLSKPNQLP